MPTPLQAAALTTRSKSGAATNEKEIGNPTRLIETLLPSVLWVQSSLCLWPLARRVHIESLVKPWNAPKRYLQIKLLKFQKTWHDTREVVDKNRCFFNKKISVTQKRKCFSMFSCRRGQPHCCFGRCFGRFTGAWKCQTKVTSEPWGFIKTNHKQCAPMPENKTIWAEAELGTYKNDVFSKLRLMCGTSMQPCFT